MSDEFQVGPSEAPRETGIAKRNFSVRKVPRRYVFWATIVVLPALVLVAVPLLGKRTAWVGSEKVEFQFLIIDAATQKPVPNCVVLVLRSEDWKSPDMLVTGNDGTLSVVKRCTTSGSSGLFRESRFVSTGLWSFRVDTPGYESSGFISADDYRSQIEKHDNGYVLPIRVELKPVAGLDAQ